jgi:glutathione peroxidase
MITDKPLNIYNFSTTSINGKQIDLKSFENKVIVVVNTASKCGLTPQYEGLQRLHLKYKDQGLVIIGFPCNQFGAQEPQSEVEISENCLLNYGVSFTMTHKIEVNGPNADPIFTYLKDSLPGLLGLKDIKWNFTKFLIDKTGKPFKRFAPTDEPLSIEKDIIELLGI